MKLHVLSIILCLVMLGAALFQGWPVSGQTQINIYGGDLIVTVTSAKHPVSGAKVTLKLVRSSSDVRSYSKTTNKKGECTFSGLYIGTYEAHVEVPGYLPRSDTFAIGPGLFTKTRNYALLPDESVMGVIKGTITDKSGRGIPQAEVRIVRRDTGIEHLVISDPGGTYEKVGLIPGKYLINVNADKYQPRKREVKLIARQVATKDFTLTPR